MNGPLSTRHGCGLARHSMIFPLNTCGNVSPGTNSSAEISPSALLSMTLRSVPFELKDSGLLAPIGTSCLKPLVAGHLAFRLHILGTRGGGVAQICPRLEVEQVELLFSFPVFPHENIPLVNSTREKEGRTRAPRTSCTFSRAWRQPATQHLDQIPATRRSDLKT